MIDLFYWSSPNAQKILMFLEEAGLPFNIVPIDTTTGAQYAPEFATMFPNSRIPAIVDHDPEGGGDPVRIFESGAILLYLAEKTGRFLANDLRTRMATMQWLFWQVGGLGPIGGQAIHFRNYAPYNVDYALQRYGQENARLVGVLDGHLQKQEFIAGDYSIADIACYPWIFAHTRRQQLEMASFPALARWFDTIRERPATHRAYAWIDKILSGPYVREKSDLTREAREILFGKHAV